MAFKPLQTYKIAVTGTASTALEIPLPAGVDKRYHMQAKLRGKTTDIVYKWGGAGVTADATPTSSALPAGCHDIASGAIELIDLIDGQTHISAISEDETSTGTLFVTIGFGEKI